MKIGWGVVEDLVSGTTEGAEGSGGGVEYAYGGFREWARHSTPFELASWFGKLSVGLKSLPLSLAFSL